MSVPPRFRYFIYYPSSRYAETYRMKYYYILTSSAVDFFAFGSPRAQPRVDEYNPPDVEREGPDRRLRRRRERGAGRGPRRFDCGRGGREIGRASCRERV